MIRTPLLAASALAMFAMPALAEESRAVWRVFIGDHAAPKVTAFDLDDPETRWTFDTKGQTKLYSAAEGTTVVAVQSNDDQVNFIRSGVHLSSHGDHSDISVTEPAALEQVLTGPRPFHVVAHGGNTIINYDKGGYAEILPDDALHDGELAVTKFPQALPHHGFVAHMGDAVLSTVAAEGDAPRLGLQAFDAAGKPVGDLATCTGIHGEAFSGAYLVAGCKEGVLTARAGDTATEFAMLPYPAELTGATTGTLLGAHAMQIFLGNYGADGLVVIDPEDTPHFQHIALPFRRVDFILDPARPQLAYVLTEDGNLHRVNLLNAQIEDSARVTGPYSMDGDWNDPRPRLAVAGDRVLVTDPAEQALRVVAFDTLQVAQTVPVEGVPYNLVAIGGSGLTH